MRKLCLSFLLTTISTPALAQDVFIDDATVLLPTGIERDIDIVMSNGIIRRVGVDLTAPNNADVINAQGQWVTPALFAPMSGLGLSEIGNESNSNDSRAADSKTSVSMKASDSFNPHSSHIGNARRRGIGYAVIAPSASGKTVFGGTGMVAKLDGLLRTDHNEEAFVYLDMGENGSNRAGGSRAAAMSYLRAALDDAATYPIRYDGPEDGDALSRQDAVSLAKAVKGEMPLIIGAHRASDLISLIDLKQDYAALDIIIVGAAEGWMVADELSEANIKVIIDPLDNLPTRMEKIGSRLDNILILDQAGVDYAIANLTSLGVAKPSALSQHAGNAVGEGLSWGKAFTAISSGPASWFNIDVGSIAAGKPSTLVVWDGDPLEVMSAPTHMWLDGKAQSLQSRQVKLRDRYNPKSNDTRPHKYR